MLKYVEVNAHLETFTKMDIEYVEIMIGKNFVNLVCYNGPHLLSVRSSSKKGGDGAMGGIVILASWK